MRPSEYILSAAILIILFIGSTSFMPPGVYSSVWWLIFWIIILAAVIFAIVKRRLWKRKDVLLFHLSLVFIIAGGVLSASTAVRGTVHLRPGMPERYFTDRASNPHRLPAEITLLSFEKVYYPGMRMPRDFKSTLLTSAGDTLNIAMNHIGRVSTYRLYQTSFDEEGGTILTVSNDPYGITMTYTGFALFFLAGAWMLIRAYLQSFKRKRRVTEQQRFNKLSIFMHNTCILFLLLVSSAFSAKAASPNETVNFADSMARCRVLYNGREVPFNSVATQFSYKITGKSHVKGMSPEDFVASLIEHREAWYDVPFIHVKSKALQRLLHSKNEYVSPRQLYTADGHYLPQFFYKGGEGNLDKEIIALDEKVSLLAELWNRELFTSIPQDFSERRSESSIRLEILYNRLRPTLILFILTISLSLVLLAIQLFRRKSRKIKLMGKISPGMLASLGLLSFIWHWYISAHIPLVSTGDLMTFIAICLLFITFWLACKGFPVVFISLILFCSAFLFLIGWLGTKNPTMTPLMPVLATPWLAVHVALIMIAYALLALTLPASFIALIAPSSRPRMSEMIFSILPWATYILGLGIIVGAMWANVSWGRYWAWDPKETWALVTLLLYAIPLHKSLGLGIQSRRLFIYLILISLSLVMTYYGVNFLPSLHAYQ